MKNAARKEMKDETTISELIDHLNEIILVINNKPAIDDAFKKALQVHKTHKAIQDRESIEKRLQALEEAIIANKEYLDVAEAARYLGVSKSEIYHLTSSKVLPFYRPGGKKVYIYKFDLVDYLSKHHIESNEEAGRRIIYERSLLNKPSKK